MLLLLRRERREQLRADLRLELAHHFLERLGAAQGELQAMLRDVRLKKTKETENVLDYRLISDVAQRADAIAEEMNVGWILPEHLVLALCESQDPWLQAIRDRFGISAAKYREAVRTAGEWLDV